MDRDTCPKGRRPAWIDGGVAFLRRQQGDWIVTMLRTSLDKFAYQMVFPYLSIYIVALGATGTQLGLVNSIGMLAAGFFSPLLGWFIDRIGPKRIYLAGIVCLGLSYLLYGLAHHWGMALLAMTAYWLGFATSVQSCATICGNCLINRDRATGMLICETVAAGLLGMAGPMIATWIVTSWGGVQGGGIRPLFLAGFVVTIGTFWLVWRRLSDRRWTPKGGVNLNLWQGLAEVMQGSPQLRKWLVVAAVSQLPLGMVLPFSQVFAHTVKGAQEWTLGAMVTASALVSICLAIPLGRWADRIGRKRVLYLIMPLFWLSNLLLVWAPSQAVLILAGGLQGFFFIGAAVSAAMERELVPSEVMGRWIGINRFGKMFLAGLLALPAGLLWDRVGPQSLFLIYVAIDALVRLPLLISIPETLHLRHPSGALDG